MATNRVRPRLDFTLSPRAVEACNAQENRSKWVDGLILAELDRQKLRARRALLRKRRERAINRRSRKR